MTTKITLPGPVGKSNAAIVIFGREEGGKAHASKFTAIDREAALRAASLMKFQALNVDNDRIIEIAAMLPDGRIFDSGKAFVPFVKQELCEELERLAQTTSGLEVPIMEVATAPAEDEVTQKQKAGPKDRADIAVGHVVLAVDVPDDGWWEAIVERVHASGTKAEPLLMLTLRWKLWPEEATLIRRADHVALLPVTVQEG